MQAPIAPDDNLFRPALQQLNSRPWLFVSCLFAVHAIIRFFGLHDPRYFPLSMVMIWPLSWILSPRQARRWIGFKAPSSWQWFWIGPAAAVGVLGVCAALAWTLFGDSNQNWFVQHGLALHEVLTKVPDGTSPMIRFWIVTLPAMVFSPLAEEFLYRGFMLSAFAPCCGYGRANGIQGAAFALVHLAHYGLTPFDPGLIALWLPSMFVTALVLGWIVRMSESLWPAVVAHAVYNLGMNCLVFILLPDRIGV